MDKLEILARAWKAGTVVEGLEDTEAIRAIQKAEGFQACFGCGFADTCGQYHCAFREDCLKIKVIEDPCEIIACELNKPG